MPATFLTLFAAAETQKTKHKTRKDNLSSHQNPQAASEHEPDAIAEAHGFKARGG